MMVGGNEAILLFVVTLTAFASACLLLWSWAAARHERLLLFAGASYLLAACSAALFYARGLLPEGLAVGFAYSLNIEGFAMTYAGLCTFNGRPVPVRVLIAAPLIWILICVAPGIANNEPALVVISSVIASGLLIAAALEAVRVHDGIRGRRALALLLAIHVIAMTVRVPIILLTMPAVFAFQGPRFLLVMAELLFFLQMGCYLIVSLPKERVELVLKHAAHTDLLTGLANRRAFFEQATRLLDRHVAQNRAISMIVFDLDRFKKINDSFGHAAGDAVLVTFAEILRKMLRAGDICARLGGEEFVALIPETDAAGALLAAERVVRGFELEAAFVDGRRIGATVSAGLASYSPDVGSLDGLLRMADDALYVAKLSGRNRVSCASQQNMSRTAEA